MLERHFSLQLLSHAHALKSRGCDIRSSQGDVTVNLKLIVLDQTRKLLGTNNCLVLIHC